MKAVDTYFFLSLKFKRFQKTFSLFAIQITVRKKTLLIIIMYNIYLLFFS